MRWFRRILSIALAGAFFYAALRFSSENAELVAVNYLAGESAAVALWQALGVAACVGALLAALPLGFLWTRARLLAWQYRRTLSRQEAEIHQLRNLPISQPENVSPKQPSEVASASLPEGSLEPGA